MDPSTMYLTAFLIIGGIIFLVLFFHYVPFFFWLSAKVSGVNISLVQLFLMRIRNVPPYIIVPGMIEAHKAGLQNITRDELEAHYLAGKVDGGCHLERQLDIGFRGGYQCVYHPLYVTSGKVVRFQFVAREISGINLFITNN